MGSGTSNGCLPLPLPRTPRQLLRERLAMANFVAVLAFLLATIVFPLIPLIAYYVVTGLALAVLATSACIFLSWKYMP